MTTGKSPFEDFSPVRDISKYQDIFKLLHVTPDKQDAVARELQHWIERYAVPRRFTADFDRARTIKWLAKMRKHAGELARLIEAAPFPYDEHPILGFPDRGDLDADPMPPLVKQLLEIERSLAEDMPTPRPRSRPKMDYRDLVELVGRIEPLYFALTGRKAAAGNVSDGSAGGPFVWLMRELLKIAGEKPVRDAIKTAVAIHKSTNGNPKRSTKIKPKR